MSIDSDRQHLLAELVLPPPHSSAASFVSVATITDHKTCILSPSPPPSTVTIPDTATASVVVPSTQTQTPYRGFPSEAAYLAALHAWATEKQYVQLDTALVGWYGQKTTEYYVNKPGLSLRAEAKARKEEKKRRATMAGDGGEVAAVAADAGAATTSSKTGGLRWPRRATLARLTQTTTR